MDPRARSQVDISADLAPSVKQYPQISPLIAAAPVTVVAQGDGMFNGDGRHYLQVGLSAIQMMLFGLESLDRRTSEISTALDYACGYGRVTRWMQSVFTSASLHAADLDPKAANAVSSLMKIPTTVIAKDLSISLPSPYDLIWVGSLLTHLAEGEVFKILKYLKSHLAEKGMLLVTTHGDYVVQRMRTREKLYNLNEVALDQIVDDYKKYGSAFSPYRGLSDYGISVLRPSRLVALAQDAGLDVTFVQARGWAKHQDCFCLTAVP